LLDLDLGRNGGGYGRIKTVIGQLVDNGVPRERLLELEGGEVLSAERFNKMHEWTNIDNLAGWTDVLTGYQVYFSEPLDLDMSMLAAFPDAYEKCIPAGGGPKMTPEAAAAVVLGEGGPGLAVYKDALAVYEKHMPAYRYHFLTRSKPATHLQAFTYIDDEELKSGMPKTYRALLTYVADNLRLT